LSSDARLRTIETRLAVLTIVVAAVFALSTDLTLRANG